MMTPLSPTAFAGLLVGLSELILAYLSYSYSKLEPLKKLKLLAYGLIILAVKEVIFNILYLLNPFYEIVGTMVEAIGLTIVTYSVISMINMNTRYFIALMVVLAAISSTLTVVASDPLILDVSFTFFLPLFIALILFRDYVRFKDGVLLLTSVGFYLYSLSVIVKAALALVTTSIELGVSLSLVVKLSSMVTVLVAFLK